MHLFAPARILANQLKYPQKFLLISLLFVIPLGVLTFFLVEELNSRIVFSQKEIEGAAYLRSLQKADTLVLRNQVASYCPDLLPLEKVTPAIANLQATDEKYRDILNTQEKFTIVETNWATIAPTINKLSPTERSSAYHQLHLKLRQLRSHVGDTSNLILDPDLDTYYLMDATLLKLPQLQATLAEIMVICKQIQHQKSVSDIDRARILVLLGIFEEANSQLQTNLQVAIRNNKLGNISSKIATTLEQWEENSVALEVLLENAMDRDINIRDLFEAADRSFQGSTALWEISITELEWLLAKRVKGFVYRRYIIIVILATVLLLATYFFVGFYQSVMRTIGQLKEAEQLMRSGRIGITLTLETKDELAEVIHTFNVVAVALAQSEERYRSIFENSVDGIFQSSVEGTYLRVNPALSRMYGYSSPEEMIEKLSNIAHQLYVNPDRRREFQQVIQEFKQVMGFESEVYRQDGSIIWISENARTVYNDQGDVLYYEGVVQEITDRKAAEMALKLAHEEISRLNHQLKSENLRMSAELDITRQLQKMILPREEELEGIHSLDIAGFMQPADEVGGDYYDVLRLNNRVKIGIGDVTGHGLESGVLMIMAQTAVSTMSRVGESDPARFFQVVNQVLYENVQRMRSEKSMTLILLDYHENILYISGQHEEVLVMHNSGTIERIDTIDLGFPIALTDNIQEFVQQHCIHLESGDVVLLYTDGITEAENPQKEQFGMERLCAVLGAHAHESAPAIRAAIIKNLENFIANQRVYDDITLVVIKQK